MFKIRYPSLALAVAIAIGAGLATPAQARPNVSSHAAKQHSQTPSQLLFSTINAMRAKKHLAPFKQNGKLSRCAYKHSETMANDGQDGTLYHDLKDDVCIAYKSAAENIGYASGTASTAVITMYNEMMAEGPCPSSCPAGSTLWEKHGHYLNLTSKAFTTIGIGVHTKSYQNLGQSLTWLTEDFVQP